MKSLHEFPKAISNCPLPLEFTYPFNYVPHKLSVMAINDLCKFIKKELCSDEIVRDEINHGKMFGVLVVKSNDEIGYLAAFSGNIAHSNIYPGFVPPVYDLLNPSGFFVSGEENLNSINLKVKEFENSESYMELRAEHARLTSELKELKEYNKNLLNSSKARRDELRASNPNDTKLEAILVAESQFLKAECKRKERAKQQTIQIVQRELADYTNRIDELKLLRREKSAELQELIFKEFKVRNAKGEERDLLSIFKETPQEFPPAGAGECAAPKLLQYAYIHGLEPLCMAEFWWGESPKDEVRKHGHCYPSCKSKCEPILNFMMQGLKVAVNPIMFHGRDFWPHVIYEDEWIMAIDKPSGMLSMRGKIDVPSVDEWLKVAYPGCNYYVVHRLDMDTSGILLIAKDLDVYKSLQGLFAKKIVEKRYFALISGVPKVNEGRIELPLIADIDNRPFQRVDFVNGKESITEYKVLSSRNGVSRVEFRPLTGRTHQLRVHAAHLLGLNAPIVGDNLYGNPGRRLMLHAESVQFIHPVTKCKVVISSPIPF